MPESLCLRHGNTLPCGGQRRDVSVPAQQVLILVLCLPVWVTSPFPVYIQDLLGGEPGVICFSLLIFSPCPFLFWGLYFEAKCQAPCVTAVAAVDLFDQGERGAQPRWFSQHHLFVLTVYVTNCLLLAASFR